MREVIVFIVALIALLIVTGMCITSDHNAIQEWAKDNRCQVISIDQCTFLDTGPFWPDEDSRIYKVGLIDHFERNRIAYFRFSILGLEQEWAK